jgi:crossover junction endodeoxyribonuclease RuvC
LFTAYSLSLIARILGIDPGTSLIGWGIIEISGNEYRPIDYGEFRTQSNVLNRDRIKEVYNFFDKLIKKHKPDQIAIEDLFFFKNAKTVIKVSEIRGVLLLVATQNNISITEPTPLQVKQTVAQYGKADKKQIQQSVKLLLGLKEIPKPDDVADALAIAIAGSSTHH